MIHWIELGTALLVYIFVLIVPGPNMVIVYNYAIRGNSTAAILAGVGYGTAATILALLSYSGVSALKDKIPFLEEAMFIISGSLLIWFGYKITTIRDFNGESHEYKKESNASYIFSAFTLNLSNPKAIALLTSIYGGVLSGIYHYEAGIFIAFCFFLELIWYYFLCYFFSSDLVVSLSTRFITKIASFSKMILIMIGGFFVMHSIIMILGH